MTRDDFVVVMDRVAQAWPRFARGWNEFNREVAFKLLSPFRLDQVTTAIEDHRYENPDQARPEFQSIAAKLWGRKRAASGRTGPPQGARDAAMAWGKTRSDEDLDHLRYLAEQSYQASVPKFIGMIRACAKRSPLSYLVCRSMEHGEALRFEPGSDEWHEVMAEFDRQERRRAVVEYQAALHGAGVRTPAIERLDTFDDPQAVTQMIEKFKAGNRRPAKRGDFRFAGVGT